MPVTALSLIHTVLKNLLLFIFSVLESTKTAYNTIVFPLPPNCSQEYLEVWGFKRRRNFCKVTLCVHTNTLQMIPLPFLGVLGRFCFSFFLPPPPDCKLRPVRIGDWQASRAQRTSSVKILSSFVKILCVAL